MITLKKNEKLDLQQFNYIKHRPLLSRIILPITRYLRAREVEKHMTYGNTLLDIGCGDGYFMERSRNKFDEIFGLDTLYGDIVVDKLDFADNSFDCVTMLAVIEHLDYPYRILDEIARVLKVGGQCIFTTPKHKAEWLINLYVKDIEHEHKRYFELQDILNYCKSGKLLFINYSEFIAGFNQVFILKKV